MEIIRPPLLFSACTCASLGFAFGLAQGAFAVDLVLQKVPPLTVEQAPAYPENLARYELGARAEITPKADAAAEAALLAGDPTTGYAMDAGNTTVLVSFPKIENIDSISFLHAGVRGRVTIATSNAKLPADSPQWNRIGEQDLTGETLKMKVGPIEAKYLQLTFDVNEPGRIADIGVYSTSTVAAFTMPRMPQAGSVGTITNLTNLHSRARAVYVSSGSDVKQANNMIDDQPGTVYNFAPPDAAPTAVVDLGKVTTLRRISALYSPGRGTLDFYVSQTLPGGAQAKSLQLDEAMLSTMKRVGSASGNETGRAAIDFPETTGRYILLKWTPAEAGAPFSVAEIAAFGNEKRDRLVAANADNRRVSNDYDVKDFKALGDAKEMPEEGPAEGPPTPLPEPPTFVFTPIVFPVSP